MSGAQDILWLGAHKTGTTYLQHLLAQSRSNLARTGVLYLGMQAFRSRYTRPLLYQDMSASAPMALPHGDGRYLVFDENIPSLVQDALSPYALYPEGEERALRVSKVLKLRRPMIVLGIRNFREFLPSLYCETLKSQPFQTFKSFQRTPFPALSWCDYAERLLGVFPRSHLKIYQAEAIRGREADLLKWICNSHESLEWTEGRNMTKALSARREGFSHDAVAALHDLAKEKGTAQVTAKHLTDCLSAYPRSSGVKAFDPWTEDETRALNLRYRHDIQEIKALPRVDFWQP